MELDQKFASPIPAKGARQNQAGVVQCGKPPPPDKAAKIANGIKKKDSRVSGLMFDDRKCSLQNLTKPNNSNGPKTAN